MAAQKKSREPDLGEPEMEELLGGDYKEMGHEQRAQRLRMLAEKEDEQAAAEAKAESARKKKSGKRSRDRSRRPRAGDWMGDPAGGSSESSESEADADKGRRKEWVDNSPTREEFWEEMEPQASPGFSKGAQVLVYPPRGHPTCTWNILFYH